MKSGWQIMLGDAHAGLEWPWFAGVCSLFRCLLAKCSCVSIAGVLFREQEAGVTMT